MISIPHFDLSEKIGKKVIKYNKFITCLEICYVKSFRVTKSVKKIKFEETCGELEAKFCF